MDNEPFLCYNVNTDDKHTAKEKYMDNNNTDMAHIARLREKMKEPSRKPKFIKTVWGVGYTIE